MVAALGIPIGGGKSGLTRRGAPPLGGGPSPCLVPGERRPEPRMGRRGGEEAGAALAQQPCYTTGRLGDKAQAALSTSSRQRCRQAVRHVASSPLSRWGKSILPMPPGGRVRSRGHLLRGTAPTAASILVQQSTATSILAPTAMVTLSEKPDTAPRKISRKFSIGC